jgi:hypothetical protein
MVFKILNIEINVDAGTPASSTTKTGRHDIAEILLKVALSTINQSIKFLILFLFHFPTLFFNYSMQQQLQQVEQKAVGRQRNLGLPLPTVRPFPKNCPIPLPTVQIKRQQTLIPLDN